MMVEERNGNIYSQRVANQIQVKLNNCPFTPHNFKLAYDLEGYENEKSNKLSELNKVQTRLNMENYNSRMFFEAMKLKSLSRLSRDAKKAGNDSATQVQPTGKFYHLSFEPMRIEDFKELDENKIEDDDDDDDSIGIPLKHKLNPASDRLNNNKVNENNNVFMNSNNYFNPNNSPVIPPLIKRPSFPGNEEKSLVLASVTASKFPKRGNSRKLPNIPCQIPVNKLSFSIPDLIATTKTPSLAEEIIAVYNREKKNNLNEDHDYVFPQCFHIDDNLTSRNEDIGHFTLEDLGMPEMIDPIKKYSDLYLKETYTKSIVCFLSTSSADFECASFVKEHTELERNSEQDEPSEVDAEAASSSSLSPSKEPDMPHEISSNGLPCSNPRRSRKSSRSNENGLDELKRDSSIVSGISDNQSMCSHESNSEAGMSTFPPGFPDIELYLEESDATHRGCHKFLPRHPEEIAVEIGDSLFVEKEHDDLWCEGINLRTKKRGIFPTAYATDLSLLGNVKYKYFVNFLGSIEVGQHTGHEVLYKAIKKLASSYAKSQNVSTVLSCLEIEEGGIKISERKKKTPTSRILSTIGKLSLLKNMQENEHVFLLKNITFCGILPSNDKYLGFITKHPICMKFACHVFQASNSGRSIVETIGNSLSKFHQEFLSVAYPVEDIYFE